MWNNIKYGVILVAVTNIVAEDFWTQVLNSHYVRRVSHFNTLPIRKGAIIFLGDSITEQCNWEELFDHPNMANRGIGGDVVEGIFKRLDFLKESEPASLFLMVGINNLNQGDTPEETFKGYKKIVNRIRSYNPNLKLFLQSILPINKDTFIGEPIATNEKIDSLNQNIKLLAKNVGAEFINLYPHFLNPDLQLDNTYSNDGLHLNGKGYLLWKKLIKKYMREI